MIREYGGRAPIIAASAMVEASSAVIGDVELGEESSVWFHCVLRGDINSIRIGSRTNIQDLTVVHVLSRTGPVIIGDEVTIGHRAVVHGCTIRDRVIVGIGAIVLDGAVIGEESVIGAGTLVPPGCVIPPGSFVLGSPARVARPVTEAEVGWILRSASNYVEYARSYLGARMATDVSAEDAS